MLKKLFTLKKRPSGAQAPELTPAQSHVMQQFLGSRGLPTMPAAAQKAFELSINPNAEARDFIEVIKADEALSARVLKIANSVFFDRGKKSQTIDDAVMVIGLSEVRGLMNASALSDLFPSRHPARQQFWANAIATAIAARLLAQRSASELTGLAFTAGLMHDIGKLLMLQRAPDEYNKVLKEVQIKGCSFIEAESKVFIFDHCQLGHYLAQRWNFSEQLTLAIRCHHEPWSEQTVQSSTQPGISQLIKSADLMAHALGIGHPSGYSKLQNNCAALMNPACLLFNISEQEKADFLLAINSAYQKEAELYQ